MYELILRNNYKQSEENWGFMNIKTGRQWYKNNPRVDQVYWGKKMPAIVTVISPLELTKNVFCCEYC